jgi:hypothetical protein
VHLGLSATITMALLATGYCLVYELMPRTDPMRGLLLMGFNVSSLPPSGMTDILNTTSNMQHHTKMWHQQNGSNIVHVRVSQLSAQVLLHVEQPSSMVHTPHTLLGHPAPFTPPPSSTSPRSP